VKVELSSEADLFFHYTHIVDDKAFAAMRDEQKLMIDFPSYASVLASSFNNAIKVCASAVNDTRADTSTGAPRLALHPTPSPPLPVCVFRSRTPSWRCL